MFEWIKKHRIFSFIIVAILTVFILLIMPLIINRLYYRDTQYEFLKVGYDLSTILNYYGAILTFLGTSILGFFTLYQSHVSQKKTDEVNKLTLELQKKSMAMAEMNYMNSANREQELYPPKFEVKNTGCNGCYTNLQAKIVNVSNIIVSNLKSIDFNVYDVDNNRIVNSTNVQFDTTSLVSGKDTRVKFNNEGLRRLGDGNQLECINNARLEWSFQCEGEDFRVYYYKACFIVKNSSDFNHNAWDIKLVG